jgi:tape measure domain-containing protein
MALGTTLKIGFDGASVKRGLDQLSGNVGKFAASVGKMGVASLAAGLTGAGIAAVAFAKSSSDAASGMETLETQFGVLLKSTDAAKSMIEEFREEAIKSPLSVEDYAKAGKTLLAFGMSSEKVMPSLKALGDVSMGNAERFESLSLAFAQTQAAGRLMGQEVLQFVNAGFNPLQQIAQKTGRSMKDLKKDMEDGKISAAMVADAFADATKEGGLFFGALEKGAGTTEGKIAKLKDTVFGLKVAFGTGFNEGLKDALDATNNFLPQFNEKMTIAGQYIGTALSEAIEGDTSKFELIGRVIGENIWAGIKNFLEGSIIDGISAIVNDGMTRLGKAQLTKGGEDKVNSIRDSITGNLAAGKEIGIAKNAVAPGVANQQMKIQTDKIQAGLDAKVLASKIAQEVQKAQSGLSMPGINGKTQVSFSKALGYLMSIDKKLTEPAPAKM